MFAAGDIKYLTGGEKRFLESEKYE